MIRWSVHFSAVLVGLLIYSIVLSMAFAFNAWNDQQLFLLLFWTAIGVVALFMIRREVNAARQLHAYYDWIESLIADVKARK